MRPVLLPSLAVLVLLGWVGLRASELDRGTFARNSARPAAVGPATRELVRSPLAQGQSVVFEVCSAALLDPARAEGLVVEVLDLHAGEPAFSLTLDPAHPPRIRRGSRYGCFVVARAESLGVSGTFAITARASRPIAEPFVGRVVARAPLSRVDLAAVLLLATLAALGFVLLVRRPVPGVDSFEDEAPPEPVQPAVELRLAALAIGALVVASVAVGRIPIAGSLGALVRASVLLVVQLAFVAYAATRAPARAEALLGAAPSPPRALLLAPLLAIGVRLVAALLIARIPRTGTSAIETLAAPSTGVTHVETVLDPLSGLLVIAAVSVVAPVVEELFHRGLIFGAVARARGVRVAAFASAIVFVLGHLPQTLGNPGALVSIALLSIVSTMLRTRTGGVTASVATHFLHNATIAIPLVS